MSLINIASLVITPNAVKEGKLYSVVPNTPLGDMDVVRATTATRVNSAGLIEVVPRNLFQYSQNLANVAWATFAGAGTITRTANYAIAPDGSMTATRIQNSGGSTVQWTYQNGTISSNGTISMYVKRTGATNQTFRLFGNNGNAISLNLTATSEWQRFQFVINQSPSLPCGITVDSSGNTADLLVWGAQLEAFPTATEYFPTTTRLNIPRIDYTNGSCPSLLVEPQRTNVVLYSEQFDNANWNKPNTNVTANSATSPSGLINADTITADGVSALHVVQTNNISFTTATSYSLSVFAKKGTNDFIQLLTSSNIGGMFANFNLNTGVVGTLGTVTGSNPTSSITNFGNGWYKCTINFTANNTTIQLLTIAIVTSASAARAEANSLTTSVFLWGAQLEVGSYPTSYIPTVASTVTRNADVISKTGISSLIGQTEGTIFIEADNKILGQTNRTLFYVSDATVNNLITVNYSAAQANTIRFFVVANGAAGALTFIINTAPLVKIAVTYKNGVNKIFINGSLIYTQTGASFSSNLAELYLGTNRNINEFIGERIKSFQMYKTELTNTECITLTTL